MTLCITEVDYGTRQAVIIYSKGDDGPQLSGFVEYKEGAIPEDREDAVEQWAREMGDVFGSEA